ncbi:hypothetical protein Ae201684_015643 [Aphanomyces euteiches]|uniref:Serine protease n=1 Tax=Aphanomyces euteiches TaxID=100861 RepID=A0A6G0WEL9_9STRA|nr:hypothetical protein Ae201684_015643 [Aphanomyces euteiches]
MVSKSLLCFTFESAMWSFAKACLVLSIGLVGLVASQDTTAMVPLDLGLGCARGTYPTSPTVVSFVVDQPQADLLLVHFGLFDLPPSDFIAVRSVVNHTVGGVVHTIRSGALRAPFFSLPVYASMAILELHIQQQVVNERNAPRCYGFHVDGVRTSIADGNKNVAADESLCGVDDSKSAECYINTSMYRASKAVVRLVTNRPTGSAFCTAFLLGNRGHLLTNNHCIKDETDAENTMVEFMAEGTSCDDTCDAQGACAQNQFIRGVRFIVTSIDLDYSLVQLQDEIPSDAGFLQLRASGPVLNEKIYIPQHPMGWGKHLAVVDGNKPGTITTLSLSGCATDQAGYMLDTQPGSSGAPVLSMKDNTVVALHHCGGCPNAGIQSQKLIADMRRRGVLPVAAVANHESM